MDGWHCQCENLAEVIINFSTQFTAHFQKFATQFTPHLRKDFLEHAYHDGGALNFILDDGGLWNHSDKPNTGGGPDPLSSYALRDLDVGEELRDDYATYQHPAWLVSLCREFNVDLDYFQLPQQ